MKTARQIMLISVWTHLSEQVGAQGRQFHLQDFVIDTVAKLEGGQQAKNKDNKCNQRQEESRYQKVIPVASDLSLFQ